MERRRPGQRRRLGAYRGHELLTGVAEYPVLGYDGYGDGQNPSMEDFISEEMRLDWEENRTALLKFWRSGEYTSFETFPGESKPWLFIRGSKDTLPWAAKIFDKDGGDPKLDRAGRPRSAAARP
jgi:hypothetical protein